MKYDPSEGAAFAVRSAYLDLLDAISRSASGQNEDDVQTLHSEAEKFIVAMLASVILEDGHIRQEEAEFLCELLNIHDVPGGAIRYVNEYACRWPSLSTSTPKFLSVAINHDHEAAGEMLRMIQIIGNNASVSDAQFAICEHAVVRDCIARLEAALSTDDKTEQGAAANP